MGSFTARYKFLLLPALFINPTRSLPALSSRERCSSPHMQTCDPHTHTPLGMVNPRMLDPGLSSQETPSCVKSCHYVHRPCDNPHTHSFSLSSTPIRCPPTWGTQGSSPHMQICDPHTHPTMGMVNPRMQDTSLSFQENTASLDQGPHRMCEAAPFFSFVSLVPLVIFLLLVTQLKYNQCSQLTC